MIKSLFLALPLLLALNLSAGTPVIPVPASIVTEAGSFTLNADTRILADDQSRPAAELLAARLRAATGFDFKIKSAKANPVNAILLTTAKPDVADGAEGYELSVKLDRIIIRAATPAGVFYGTQTLLQLLPAQVFATKRVPGTVWSLDAVEITDAPRFAWRGFMLDVSRHFFTKPEVEQVLDLMALYKLNTFHWHLVDDQGWRIEIKKYPKLTSVGAWRSEAGFGLDSKDSRTYDAKGRYGGFYTQNDIREVVAYAAARHITVVPEIEMPGHSTAALTAYPQFGCPDVKFSIPTKGGVMRGAYCAGNDNVYNFLDDVLAEVIPLFPGKYIHIGGDEVRKDNWKACEICQARIKAEGLKDENELQSYFIRRMETIVNARGKTIIGWSEIREGGIAPSAALMDWIGGGAESARSGHDVVMSPTKSCYFDYYQSTNHAQEQKAIGGFLPLKKVYAFDPMPDGLDAAGQAHVLGGQANLWTEYIPSLPRAEYMMFPRLCALAEVDWSPKASQNWDDFQGRAALNEKRLDAMGVNYRPLSKPN